LFGFGAMFPREKKSSSPGLFASERKIKEARIEEDRLEGIFRPDGMVGDTPYRMLPNGETEALIQGGMVRFRNLDHLRSMTNAASAPPTEAPRTEAPPD